MIMIRDYRKRAGLTMEELGARLGVSESAIQRWERGDRRPSYERLLQIAEELDCTVNDLMGYAGASFESSLPEVTMVGRAAAKMTPERRQDMIRLLKIAFPEEFENE